MAFPVRPAESDGPDRTPDGSGARPGEQSARRPRSAQGRHRKPRRISAGAALAGIVVLGGGGAALGSTLASSGPAAASAAQGTSFDQDPGVPTALAHSRGGKTPTRQPSPTATPDGGTAGTADTTDKPEATSQGTPGSASGGKAAARATPKGTKAPVATRPSTSSSSSKVSAARAGTPSPAASAPAVRAASPKPSAPRSSGTSAAIRAPSASSSASSSTGPGGWTAPVSGGTVGSVGTGGHGSGRTRTGGASDGEGRTQGSGRSTGVDFLVPVGTAVHAVTAGTVVSADREGSGGLTVVIRQADGDYAVYGELSQALVSPGQTVTGGRLVGLSGTLGDDGRAGLRFEVRTAPEGGTALDPLAYLREHGVSV